MEIPSLSYHCLLFIELVTKLEKKIYISFLRILGTNNHGRNENILCREITILIDVDIILCHRFPLISFDLNHRRWKYPLSSSILVYTRATSPSHRRNCSSSVTLSSMTDWRRVGRCVAASTRWKQNTPTPCFSNDLGVVCPLLDASEREKTGRLFPWKISEFSLPPGMSGTEHLTRPGRNWLRYTYRYFLRRPRDVSVMFQRYIFHTLFTRIIFLSLSLSLHPVI